MERKSPWVQYKDRLERVVCHIHDQLDDDLDFDRLAEIACLSPWHWHRIYRGVYGETVTATVKRLRLHRAAGDLANSSQPIAAIAARAGYPSVPSFTRIFKATYGLTPGAYRTRGSHTRFEHPTAEGDPAVYDVDIRTTAPLRLAGVPHTGSYMAVGKSFEILFANLFARDLFAPDMTMIGVYYDDPDTVPETQLRAFAAVSVPDGFRADPPLDIRLVAGGPYAVLTHKGPYADMPKAYRWLYGPWLSQSGRTVRDEPCFEAYLNNPRDVAPTDLLSEIWMPIA